MAKWLHNDPRRRSRMAYRHEDIAAVPRGWRVRTVTPPGSGARVRIAYPPGPRRKGAGRVISILHPTRNPAYSSYFEGHHGGVEEKYFHATSLQDAKRQARAYGSAHRLRPTTLWELKSTTRAGRRYAGEWARPLVGRSEMAHKHRGRRRRRNDPDPRRRRRRGYYARHRRNDPDPRRRRRHGYGRRRHNPVDITHAATNPAGYLTQAAFGLGGAYGVIVLGNAVGSFFPTLYQDVTVTGKIVRALTRGGVAYAGHYVTRGLDAANRAALQIGAAVGIVGSLALDLIGTSFALGAGDQTQTFAGILAPVGLAGAGAHVPVRWMPGATVGAYVPGRNFPGIGKTGAYIRPRERPGIGGLGDLALYGMGDALLYHKMS